MMSKATVLKGTVAVLVVQLLAAAASAAPVGPSVKEVADGFVFGSGADAPRVHFVGSRQAGYDVVFELPCAGSWQQAAAFPEGRVWSVYSDWIDSWYAVPHHVKAQKIEPLSDGRVRASASADIAGQPWWFADVYSMEHGMVRIDRSFAHSGPGTQPKITLESRIRLPLGTDQRLLMPGVLYNNNPNSTTVGTRISTVPGGLGLYEEHRLPVPMVNIESAVNGLRTYGSLLAKPSKLQQGHKGDDHWWSLGLEYGQGCVDLLSLSGPVATNGKKSQVYGHLNGFDPYDDAYLDVQGPAVFTKTLYLDLGAGIKTGYAFRETLWKSYDVFRPIETPHVPFAKAMTLIANHGRTRYVKPEGVLKPGHAAGFVRFGNVQIVDGDAVIIVRPDGKKDIYKFHATGKPDSYSAPEGAAGKVIGIEIADADAWFTKTVDRVIAAINKNNESPVTAEGRKILAPGGESWGMRLFAKVPGAAGEKIGLAEQGGKIEFTRKLFGPWGLMGKEPRITHLLPPAEIPASGAAGYGMLPGSNHFGYAWIGGGLAIAYGTLCQAERTGDETAKQEAVSAVQFFVRNAHAGVDGLYYGEYAGDSREWGGLASRQYAENLTHLASLSELGQRMKLPEADEWLAALKRGGEFLLRSPKHKGLFPKGWTVDGKAADWPAAGEPPVSSLSAAGAFCVVPLAKLAIMTGDARYRAAAAEAMDAYWREFGETLAAPPWGATLDAGSEDKEAAWGMMGAALETYAATLEPKFLQMAKDAADLTLTWMYFHDVGLYFRPQSPLLHDHVNTIGWTFISTQNQEIDCFGYYMAPDYYRLGLLTGDDRYKQIGRVMFEACTQTISRPGAMFGKVPGIQAEHYNQTNCTYVGGQPGSWRGGSQLTLGIGWITSAALYGGTRLSEMAPDQFWLGP